MSPLRSIARDALHLGVLSCLAVQPLFELLAAGPEFFFVQRTRPLDLVVLVGVFFLGVPAVLVLVEGLAARLAPDTRPWLHRLFVAALLALVALPILGRSIGADAAVLLAGAAVLGVLGALVYARMGVVRSALSLVSPVVLLAPGLFLFGSPVVHILLPEGSAGVASGDSRASAPVVVVVFDEFSTISLLDSESRIDAVRYPHFAALAAESTWLRNTTSVADTTEPALAAILTGRYPGPTPLAEPATRLRNLYTLLGGSHDVHAMEIYPYCPEEICARGASDPGTASRLAQLLRDAAILELHLLLPPELRTGLPEISQPVLLLDRAGPAPGSRGSQGRISAVRRIHNDRPLLARSERFRRFVASIQRRERPGLHFLHILLPHEPSVHLPSGRLCLSGRYRESYEWEGPREGSVRAQQRHLLQVAYADTLIGELVAHLREQDLYDETLLVITADHGVSHDPPASRRVAEPANRCEIMSVPLLIKAPGQRRGVTNDRNVETVDILPSVADLLGLELPWSVDGRSALDPAAPVRETKTLMGPYFYVQRGPYGFFDADRRARFPAEPVGECRALERKLALFGSGASRGQPFAIGPFGDLLGRSIGDLATDVDPLRWVEIDRAGEFDEVDPAARMLPCTVEGRVRGHGNPGGAALPLAVAVNGAIRAVTRAVDQDGAAEFSTPIPEQALRPGANRIEVFALAGTPEAARLLRLPSGRGSAYSLSADGRAGFISGSDGSRFRVVPGALRGSFERRRVNPVYPNPDQKTAPGASFAVFRGFAVDAARHLPAENVLVFVGGRFHDALRPSERRADVAERYGSRALLRSGFHFSLPVFPQRAPGALDVRVFAVSGDGRASELRRR